MLHLDKEEESPLSDEAPDPPPPRKSKKTKGAASSSRTRDGKRTVKSIRKQPRDPLAEERKKRLSALAEQGKGEDDKLSDENDLNVIRGGHHRM